jgi:hypothetical protein
MSKKTKLSALLGLRTMMSRYKMWVFVDVQGKRRVGELIGINSKTVWVRVMHGAKSYFTISRHYKKHNVSAIFRTEDRLDENVHTSIGN